MIPTIIFLVAFVILYYQFACKIGKWLRYKETQNNNLAVHNRNKALIYGMLCIIFFIALLLNRDEFLIINQSKHCSMKENQMQNYTSRTIQDEGLLELEVFLLKPTDT